MCDYVPGPCEQAFLDQFPAPDNPDDPDSVWAWEMMRGAESFVDWAEEQYSKGVSP